MNKAMEFHLLHLTTVDLKAKLSELFGPQVNCSEKQQMEFHGFCSYETPVSIVINMMKIYNKSRMSCFSNPYSKYILSMSEIWDNITNWWRHFR